MNISLKYHNPYCRIKSTLVIAIFVLILGSCSTGIESTKTIRMSKEDMKLMAKTDEQLFSLGINGTPLADWEAGKPFMAMSERTSYIFEPSSVGAENEGNSIEGKILKYAGTERAATPDLREECILLFSDGRRTYRYPTGKTPSEALLEIDSSKIPLMSDLALTEQWKTKLSGITLWTKSNLWYDKNGERKSGLKFAKCTVKDVLPATGDFPMLVRIESENGEDSYLHMNYTSDMADSRNFASLFYLSDPKSKYPQINKENWNLIKQGKIGLGMTKEECRLSLGNPDELDSGHNTSHTLDIWQYSNGTYLMFTDGLLTRFRQ